MQTPKGHVLKFVHRGKTFNPHVGVRTFPRQTYGVSQQSPDEFKQRYTFKGEHGYIYKHENKPQFQYPSQRHFFDLHRSSHLGHSSDVNQNHPSNSVTFHRKKGRLSQFMDKNGWMAPVTPIMGFQRGQNARMLNNRDRQERINSLKPKNNYQNPVARKAKVNPQCYNTISEVMSEKLRIRKKRQTLMEKQGPPSARTIQKDADPLLVVNVQEKMAKSNMDFYSTTSTFYQRGGTAGLPSRQISTRLCNNRSKRLAEESRQMSPYKTLSPVKQSREQSRNQPKVDIKQLDSEELHLQEWFNTTCAPKWDYRPKKLDTQQREQQRQMLMSVNL